MTVFTTETLLMACVTLANATKTYFSLVVDTSGYTVWSATEYVKTDNLEENLLWAYKRLARVAKDQGMEIVDVEVSVA